MLHIVNLEEIHGLLLQVPKLIDRLEQRDRNFVPDVKNWLTVLEQVLVNNHMPMAGNIAALRGVLGVAERGIIPAGIVFHGRPTARKIKEDTAADVVRQARTLVSNAVREDYSRIAEAERLGHQLVALAKSQGLVSAKISVGDHTRKLKETWGVISADSNIAPGAIRLESLVGQNDALIVLDRAMTADTMSGPDKAR